MFWDIDHGNQSIYEEQREPSRKGDIFATMGHTRLQGRTRRERALVAGRTRTPTSRIHTSGFPGCHRRHDRKGRGKQRYWEGSIKNITIQRNTGLDRRDNKGRAMQRQ